MTQRNIYGIASVDSVEDTLDVFDTYAMDEPAPDHDTEGGGNRIAFEVLKNPNRLNYELQLSLQQKSSSYNDVRMTPPGEQKKFESRREREEKPRRQTVQIGTKTADTVKQEKGRMRRSYSAGELQSMGALERLAFWKWFKPWKLFSHKKNSQKAAATGCGVKRSQSSAVPSRRRQSNVKLSTDLIEKLERCSPRLASDVRLLKQEGSYYAISKEDAENLLKRYEIGTYLVRPNSDCDSFCLSYVVHLDKVEHANISRSTGTETGHVTTTASETFELVGKSNTVFNSLLDVVNMGRNKGFQVISATKSKLTFFLDSPPMDIALRPQYRK